MQHADIPPSGIEANLIILCCSLPALRVFLRHIAPKWMTNLSSRGEGHSQGDTGQLTGNKTSRIRSGYGKMGYDPERAGAYPLHDHPYGKDPYSTRCEYVGNKRDSPSSYLEDTTSSTPSISDAEGNDAEKRHRVEVVETVTVVSERRVV